VLVRLPSWLGDFVASEPVLRALEARLEHGRLGLLARGLHLELLAQRFPDALRIPLRNGEFDAPGHYGGWDVAVLLTGSFRSAWCAWRAGVSRRVGFGRDGRGWLLTDAVTPARERGGLPLGLGRPGRGRRFLPRPLERSLAELLGPLGVPVARVVPRLEVAPPSLQRARARRAAAGLDPTAPYVLVNAGARPGSAKGVPPALWAAAIRAARASDPHRTFLLVCAPGEEAALGAVQRALGPERVPALRDPAAGLPELLAHCAESAQVWSADSGPRHLARALGRPCLVVSGPTDPRHCGIRASERVVRREVPCGPCHRERCPLSGPDQLRCMTLLEPAALLRASAGLG